VKGSLARRANAVGACLGASAWVAACTACGAGSAPYAGTQAERQFTANTAGLIDQLHQDLVVSSTVGSSLGAARSALRDHADRYAMLIAYTDFGSCRSMVRNAGGPNRRFDRVEAALESACSYLEQAANLFTLATTRSDAGALVSASRTTLKASPLLYRAKVELVAASGQTG
jgi:hypothetical protein